jgi:hypothetical protein
VEVAPLSSNHDLSAHTVNLLPGRPIDTEADKTIVFHTPRSLTLIAYSGLAVVGHETSGARVTDHWLVEQLVGGAVEPAAIAPGPKYGFDFGYAIIRVVEALNRLDPGLDDIQIVWCGRQLRNSRHGHSNPVYGRIIREEGEYRIETRVIRRWSAKFGGVLGSTPHVGDRDALMRDIEPLHGHDIDGAEAVLVRAIRERESKVIGRDCLALAAYGNYLRVRFNGNNPTFGRAGGELLPSTPLPWLVTSGHISAPTRVGPGPQTIGGLQVQVDGPPVEPKHIKVGPNRHVIRIPVLEVEQRPWGRNAPLAPPLSPIGESEPPKKRRRKKGRRRRR